MDYYEDGDGYYRFSDSNNHIHRWMAEKKIGRKLKSKEVVHHLDHDKKNNRDENLYICENQNEHEYMHEVDARRYGEKYRYAPIPKELYQKYKYKVIKDFSYEKFLEEREEVLEEEGVYEEDNKTNYKTKDGCLANAILLVSFISFSIFIVIKIYSFLK